MVDLENPGQNSSSLLLYRYIQNVYVLMDDYDRQVLDRFGLNTSQYRTLLHIEEKHGKRLTTISDRLLLSKSTITRVIDELEERQWVQRLADPEDRRAQRVILTKSGIDKREEIKAIHKKALDDVFTQFSTNEKKQLDDLLKDLSRHLESSLNGKNRPVSNFDIP